MEDKELALMLERIKKIKNLQVKDFMQKNVITLDVEDLLATAARTFVENKINGLIIMRDGLPYSILSSWDLLHVSYVESFSDKMDYLRTPLGELIENPIMVSVAPSASLAQLATVAAKNTVRTIPIMEDKKLVGVISIMDLVKLYHQMLLDENAFSGKEK